MERFRSVLILAAIAFGLGGCRGDGGAVEGGGPVGAATSKSAEASYVPPVVDSPKDADSRPVLVCFGDSLTAGYGVDPGESYPDDLQKDLDAAGYKYRVVNEGVSGNTTKDGIERLPGVVGMKPAVVVVEFGGNDGLRGVPVADSRKNLDKIVGTLVNAGAKVAIAGITLPPDYGPDYIKQFNATYSTLAQKYRVPMIPFVLQGAFGVPGMMQADRTHATATGNKIVARNVEQLVRPLLKK